MAYFYLRQLSRNGIKLSKEILAEEKRLAWTAATARSSPPETAAPSAARIRGLVLFEALLLRLKHAAPEDDADNTTVEYELSTDDEVAAAGLAQVLRQDRRAHHDRVLPLRRRSGRCHAGAADAVQASGYA